MLANIENRILENNPLLKSCLEKTLRPALKDIDGILLVNIEYVEKDVPVKGKYSGMEHVVRLRVEHQDQSPVLFYGFESPKILVKRPESSVLKSPAVSYIQLPAKIRDITKGVRGLVRLPGVKYGLDPETRRMKALEQKSTLRHDLQNALNTVDIVKRLKRTGSQDLLQLRWKKTRDHLLSSVDLIQKNRIYFQEHRGYITEVLSGKKIDGIENELLKIEQEYNALLEILRISRPEKNVLLKKAEMISGALYQIIQRLKKESEG